MPTPVGRLPRNGDGDDNEQGEVPGAGRPIMRRRVTRYSATVVPVPRVGGSWAVRVQLRNELGTIVRQALLDSTTAKTRNDADARGWRLVDAWIHRFGRTTSAA